MSSKVLQACDNCGTRVRQGYPLGRNFFCSQGQPVPEKDKRVTCLEMFQAKEGRRR